MEQGSRSNDLRTGPAKPHTLSLTVGDHAESNLGAGSPLPAHFFPAQPSKKAQQTATPKTRSGRRLDAAPAR